MEKYQRVLVSQAYGELSIEEASSLVKLLRYLTVYANNNKPIESMFITGNCLKTYFLNSSNYYRINAIREMDDTYEIF